jgi:pyruvate dehydrogenase E2 component (dihydrolipoamide acetyltransferase)
MHRRRPAPSHIAKNSPSEGCLMPIQILMPALSPTMEEGKLSKWLVNEGDTITSGTVIAEIETDKATMEVEAVDEGTVGKILVAEGTEGVKVNAPIAILLEEGEDASTIGTTSADSPQPSPPPPSAPPSNPPAAGAPHTPAATQDATPRAAPPAAPPAKPDGTPAERIFASPLARRIAAEKGLALTAIAGTGPHGRIIKRDVESATAAPEQAAHPAPSSAPMPPGTALATQQPQAPAMAGGAAVEAMPDDKILALYDKNSYELVPHDGMRRVIAQRLTQSKQTVPHFYLTVECVLDELLRARQRLNEAAPKDGPKAYKLSVNDFVIKSLALALQQVPGANATWTDGGTLRHRHSDVGVAVAVEGGLFTPVIRHAEMKTLGEISNEMKDLAGRARNRRLAPHEYQGGTTSISNLGMYGIKSFDAVINPPHATILAVGAGEKRPIVSGDEIRVATVMNCTLSCDHRVVDGALAAELLNAFKLLIEDPVRMLV